MTNVLTGALLMGAPLLWLCVLLLQALRKKSATVSLNLVPLLLAALCFLAGRIVAGKSLLSIALS